MLGGELAVPCFQKSALCWAESLLEGFALKLAASWPAAAQQTVANLVRSGRKQR